MSQRWALVLQYEGTEFAGSQWQPNRPTIQGALQDALRALTGAELPVSLAGRTDAGVHASGQVASFVSTWTEREMPPRRWVRGLNHFLPGAIAVQAAYAAPDHFDPRRDATSRTYRYQLRLARSRQPLWERTAWIVPPPFCESAARDALAVFGGRRDFAAVTPPTDERSTVRTLSEASLQRCGSSVTLTFRAQSFLHHQVRRMAGAIVEVARGRMPLDQLRSDFTRAAPGSLGPTAPACGLVLVEVAYPPSLFRHPGHPQQPDDSAGSLSGRVCEGD